MKWKRRTNYFHWDNFLFKIAYAHTLIKWRRRILNLDKSDLEFRNLVSLTNIDIPMYTIIIWPFFLTGFPVLWPRPNNRLHMVQFFFVYCSFPLFWANVCVVLFTLTSGVQTRLHFGCCDDGRFGDLYVRARKKGVMYSFFARFHFNWRAHQSPGGCCLLVIYHSCGIITIYTMVTMSFAPRCFLARLCLFSLQWWSPRLISSMVF